MQLQNPQNYILNHKFCKKGQPEGIYSCRWAACSNEKKFKAEYNKRTSMNIFWAWFKKLQV